MYGADFPEKSGCETELWFLRREGAPAELAEAALIAQRIRELVEGGFTVTSGGGERPARYGDFCILLRSANKYAHAYAQELKRLGVPARATVSGGFFAAAEVQVALSLLRVVLVSFTFGNAYSFWYSLAGAALSFLIMALLRRQDWFGELGVSVAGGVCHNIGQIAVAAIVLRSTAAAYYLPVLLLSGVLTGMAVGAAAAVLIRRVPPFER